MSTIEKRFWDLINLARSAWFFVQWNTTIVKRHLLPCDIKAPKPWKEMRVANGMHKYRLKVEAYFDN